MIFMTRVPMVNDGIVRGVNCCYSSSEKGKTTEETYEGYLSVDYLIDGVLILIFQVKKVSSRQTNRKFIGRIVHQQLHIN